MAENIELIAASDLPEATSDTVDVLCVEDGELKRKAGASLGGGGGYVVKLPSDADIESGEIAITDVSYDEFADILYNGGMLWLDFSGIEAVISEVVGAAPVMQSTNLWALLPGMGLIVRSSGMFDVMVMFPNGTWTPPTA